jgi:Sulfotransferase domain
MQVIGAGLPRTGTLTQKLALEQLGFDPCYHWVNLIADLDQVQLWSRALDGESIWDEVFDGFQATVDWPGAYFFAEIADHYPEAKVLLSVRDGASWEPSFRETIVALSHGSSMMRRLSDARAEIDPRWKRYLALVDRMFWSGQAPFIDGVDSDQLIAQMDAFNARVQSLIAPDRLLVWNVREGWEPLCAFLEVDVPAQPLPHENDRETFLGRVMDGALAALTQWRAQAAAAAAGS